MYRTFLIQNNPLIYILIKLFDSLLMCSVEIEKFFDNMKTFVSTGNIWIELSNNARCAFRSLCVLILLLGAEIWGLWRDLKDGWEHSTRLKSRTAVIATCSDVLGVMSLTVVCIVGSPFRWKSLQLVINKLIEVVKESFYKFFYHSINGRNDSKAFSHFHFR